MEPPSGGGALRWRFPEAVDAVRRGPAGSCPATPDAGTAMAGWSLRDGQRDLSAVSGATYCYSVFAIDASNNFSVSTITVTALRQCAKRDRG
jgi:hypothetical protein